MPKKGKKEKQQDVESRAGATRSGKSAFPAGKSGLLRDLGVFGLDHLESVVLAALATEEPLLLVGSHGTGKSLLLTRLAEALGLSFRHYNASLLNFDDLVGFPLPQADGELRYVQTPASIWGAGAVIFDEINRCRPDMANRMFPIIHEKRAQGLALTDLRYRWAAMNPPRDDESDDEDPYVGTRPLDAALADRFAFVVQMPDWEEYSEPEQLAIIAAAADPVRPEAAAALREALAATRAQIGETEWRLDGVICAYVRTLVALLQRASIPVSPRRAGMLRRTIMAARAADTYCNPEVGLDESAYRAVWNGLPQAALGAPVPLHVLRKAHQEAWDLSSGELPEEFRHILLCSDPVERVRMTIAEKTMGRAGFTSVVREAMAEAAPGARGAIAVHLFESGAADRLDAAVAEEVAFMCSEAVSAAEAGFRNNDGGWEPLTLRRSDPLQEALAELDPADVRAHFAANSVAAGAWRDAIADPSLELASWLAADETLRAE